MEISSSVQNFNPLPSFLYVCLLHPALSCNSFLAIQRENLQTSMEIVTSTYSSDLRNLIMYLLTNPTRVKSVNDLMPMIGARFYTQVVCKTGRRTR